MKRGRSIRICAPVFQSSFHVTAIGYRPVRPRSFSEATHVDSDRAAASSRSLCSLDRPLLRTIFEATTLPSEARSISTSVVPCASDFAAAGGYDISPQPEKSRSASLDTGTALELVLLAAIPEPPPRAFGSSGIEPEPFGCAWVGRASCALTEGNTTAATTAATQSHRRNTVFTGSTSKFGNPTTMP